LGIKNIVIPAQFPVIPAQAGTARESREGGFEVTFLDSRLRGNDDVYIEIVINNLFFGEVPG